jgi:hypothetical protein
VQLATYPASLNRNFPNSYVTISKKNQPFGPIFFVCNTYLYSNLNASIGFIFAAFLAGHTPKIIPVPKENHTATKMDLRFNNAGISNCCKRKIKSQLIKIPMIQPMRPSTIDSLKNWSKIS